MKKEVFEEYLKNYKELSQEVQDKLKFADFIKIEMQDEFTGTQIDMIELYESINKSLSELAKCVRTYKEGCVFEINDGK